TSFRHAIFLAIDAFRHRQEYDEPLENPLKKLYHEKKDDSEKVRFSIPKKHENSIIERAPRGNRGASAQAGKKAQADDKPAETPKAEEAANDNDSEQ
ncbi:MAG: 4-hydroxythreonine-4-phosphate dehydrogenase, partial [Prevotella sp.]|nr:4-hydroxythreonine-4-phosphate dehydrogenase [Prevotella sp.]